MSKNEEFVSLSVEIKPEAAEQNIVEENYGKQPIKTADSGIQWVVRARTNPQKLQI